MFFVMAMPRPVPGTPRRRRALLAGERLEDVLLELRGHPDAGVAHDEVVARVALRRARDLLDAQAEGAAGAVELDAVGEDVQEHLREAQLVRDDVLVAHVDGVDEEVELLGDDVRLDDGPHVVEKVRQVQRLLLDLHLAGLDAAHVEHVVDQAEQVLARGGDLLQVLLDLGLVVDVRGGKRRKADDGVHGRPDVVRHVVEEARLCLVGVLRGKKRPLELAAALLDALAQLLLAVLEGAVEHDCQRADVACLLTVVHVEVQLDEHGLVEGRLGPKLVPSVFLARAKAPHQSIRVEEAEEVGALVVGEVIGERAGDVGYPRAVGHVDVLDHAARLRAGARQQGPADDAPREVSLEDGVRAAGERLLERIDPLCVVRCAHVCHSVARFA